MLLNNPTEALSNKKISLSQVAPPLLGDRMFSFCVQPQDLSLASEDVQSKLCMQSCCPGPGCSKASSKIRNGEWRNGEWSNGEWRKWEMEERGMEERGTGNRESLKGGISKMVNL